MNRNKIVFWLLWIIILIPGPFAVVYGVGLKSILSSISGIFYALERISGALAFSILFIQLLIISFKGWFKKRLGDWVLRFATVEIWFVYLFIFLQLASFVIHNYLTFKELDPFYVFTQVCALCDKPVEYYITFGRVSFWLALFVAIWKKYDFLNYLIFLLWGLYLRFFVFSDIRFTPFIYFVTPAFAVVLLLLIFKKLPELYHNFRTWLD